MEIKLYKARLKTGNKTDEQIKTDFEGGFGEATQDDINNYKKMMDMVDGQEIIVMEGLMNDDAYTLFSWQEKDDDTWMEFIYLQEQDPYFGTYVDEREEFLSHWKSGEYDPSGSLVFQKEDVEILEALKGESE